MRNARLQTLLLLSFLVPGAASGAGVFPGEVWETTTPAEANMDATKLQELEDFVLGSGMVTRDGRIVWSWGDIDAPQNWASAAKPVLSTLLFLAVQQGRCDFDSPMSLFMPPGSPKDEAITFHHLANMISGYSRGENAGEAYVYNDYAINLYGYALSHGVYGNEPSVVFPEQFAFLEFEDSPAFSDAQFGRSVGVSIRDFARFGILWLNRGNWNGTQQIPDAIFDRLVNQVPASMPASTSDGPESWNLGTFGGSDNMGGEGRGEYAYNFWVNTNGYWPNAPTDLFAAVGHGGNETCIVIPSLGIVAAGVGTWQHPSTQAAQFLMDATGPTSVDALSWGKIKGHYR